MKSFFVAAAVAAILAMPATPAAAKVNTNFEGSTADDVQTQMMEQSLSPFTPPVGEFKPQQQGSDTTTLFACKSQIMQQLRAQRIKYDNDNFTENLNATQSPFSAYVFVGEQLFQYSCDWAQIPCVTGAMAQNLGANANGFPACSTDKVIFRLYKEG